MHHQKMVKDYMQITFLAEAQFFNSPARIYDQSIHPGITPLAFCVGVAEAI